MIQSKVYVNIETEDIETQIPIHEIAKRREATELETAIYSAAYRYLVSWWEKCNLINVCQALIYEEHNDPEKTHQIFDLEDRDWWVDIVKQQKLSWKFFDIIVYNMNNLELEWNLSSVIDHIRKEVEKAKIMLKHLQQYDE